MTVDIYDLQTLAELEGVTYTNLRTIMFKLRKNQPEGEPLEWRGYRFFGKPAKVIYAYKASEDIRVHHKEVGGSLCKDPQPGGATP